MKNDELPRHYQGVLTAYDLVVPSYNWMLARFEAAQSRIHVLQVFVVTVSFGVPGAVSVLNPEASFTERRFVLAAVVFLGLMILGFFEFCRGGVLLIGPDKVQKKWLQFTEWEFKKNAVFFAAKHFRDNQLAIERKWKTAIVMTILFAIELVLLLAWRATSPSPRP